jgi:hypothetical protein
MDELMLMEYLRSKGMEDMSEQEFVHKFKDFMHKHGKTSYMRDHNDIEDWDYPSEDMKYRRGRPMRRNQLGYYDMYAEYPEYALHSERKYGKPYGGFNMMQDEMYDYPMNTARSMRGMHHDEHFNEFDAKEVVADMYHIENGKKQDGEKFSMIKAKEVYERYRGTIPHNITVADIYVAINAQYHDYCELFKAWFGSNIDSKIIESAIVFWFKDTDYNKGFKLTEYFKEY